MLISGRAGRSHQLRSRLLISRFRIGRHAGDTERGTGFAMRSIALQVSISPVLLLLDTQPLLAGMLFTGAALCMMSALHKPSV